MAQMHFLAGLATDDFVILASDKASFAYGAVLVSENDDKEYPLGEKLSMVCIGEDGDVSQFGDWTRRNLRLYAIRNGYELSPRGSFHWIRKSIADGLRSSDQYAVDILCGGYDGTEKKAFLGSIDYLGNALSDQQFQFRGFGGRFCYAIMDREYRKDLSEQAALALIHKCLAETKKRFVANLAQYNVVIIDKDGRRAHSISL